MITPRRTRLHRAAGLRAFQRAIRLATAHPDLSRLRDTAVIVPSAAAADQLRRTLENHALQPDERTSADRALCLPQIVTRAGWYEAMHARLPSPPMRLTDLEREVMLQSAARDADRQDKRAPFRVRAGLLVQMLALYDDLRRQNVSVDRFEAAMTEDLERDAASDRGAERLLQQTMFLAAAFRGYEARVAASGRVDEHALRARLRDEAPARPLTQIVVTVGDRTGDPVGLWKADFDLLTRLPALEHVDIVATSAALSAGFLDRLRELLPGFEEAESEGDDPKDAEKPVLSGTREHPCLVSRDREDELAAVARHLKASSNAALERRAVVFKRPLPYMYLAHDVFGDAGIPYQTFDALPLAAEPYSAALDLVFEAVTSGFVRAPVVALLSSPHFSFEVEGAPVRRGDAAALSIALSKARYSGGADELRKFAEQAPGNAARAAIAAANTAERLSPLSGVERPSIQLKALRSFLADHDRTPREDDPLRERHLRARTAIHAALRMLTRAHEEFDDAPVECGEVAAMIRRWIEGQTFAPKAGASGVQIVDAQAARYGEFDEIFLVGLVEGEWPQPAARSIFYPQSLLSRFDAAPSETPAPGSRPAFDAERAAFRDLVLLPRKRVTLSTFELENDSIVGPSVFLEEIDRLDLRMAPSPACGGRIFAREALTDDPVAVTAVRAPAREWLDMRMTRADASAAQFHGAAAPVVSPTYAVSHLERYLRCPFLYFSERVLQLKEDPEDETGLNPRELGIFVHEVFHAFFDEWNRLGRMVIEPDNLPEARALFREILEPLLAKLPPADAVIQRTRLLGSVVDEGLAEAVFQVEAEWETPVVERLLEYPLEGEFEIQSGEERRRVRLRGKADRIDLLADGTLRIVDYKLGQPPDRETALQLPIYGVCALQHLKATTGKTWTIGQAGYIAFGADKRFVPMVARKSDGTTEDVLREAQARLLSAIDAIERGEFPPAPAQVSTCTYCAFDAVCRKDYVRDV